PRGSQLEEPTNAQAPSTTSTLVWSNGGGVSHTRQPRSSTCQSSAVEAHWTRARLFSWGSRMSTRTPRIRAGRCLPVVMPGRTRRAEGAASARVAPSSGVPEAARAKAAHQGVNSAQFDLLSGGRESSRDRLHEPFPDAGMPFALSPASPAPLSGEED